MPEIFAVLGGDARQRAAAAYLQEHGYKVYTFAVPGAEDAGLWREADVLLLPVPSLDATGLVRGTDLHLDDLPEAPLVFGGKLPPGYGTDLLEQEDYTAAVAELTAEGAVQVAMNHMDTAVNGSRFLVIGAGRIGMHLARKLRALGAVVTVTARKDRDFSKIAMFGLAYDETRRYFNGLDGYDCICNTVPATVLTPEQLAQTREDCIFLELASSPYGFDGEVCRRLGRTYLLCAALPGKTAPKTAGEIIAKEVLSQLRSRP